MPPLPKGFFEGENAEVIGYRKRYLQSFFDELLRHKAIMSYEIMEKFLKTDNESELESILASEVEKKEPNNVKEMIHMDGTVFF